MDGELLRSKAYRTEAHVLSNIEAWRQQFSDKGGEGSPERATDQSMRSRPLPVTVANQLHVYCDESGTTARFLVYGGLITSKNNSESLEALVAHWREQNHWRHEMKWHNASKSTLRRYKSFVDLFFDNAKQRHIHFAAMIVDKQAIDYRRYRKRDEILGFYIFYYRFILEKWGCPVAC